MKENTCVIYDKDEKYAQRLMGAFNEKGNAPFGLQMFTEEKQLINYLDNYSPEILMVSEDSYTYEIGKKHEGKLMILCDEEAEIQNARKEFGGNAEGIYKYQSSERIVKSVLGSTEAKASTIGIYSITEFRGKAEFGLEYAYELSQTSKVIYINLEEFSELSPVLAAENNMTLSDAYYYYKQYGGFNPKIKKTINSIGSLDYIAPVNCAKDLAFMDGDEAIGFIEAVGEGLEYDFVVIDLGNAVRQPWRLIRGCGRVYMPMEKSKIADVRVGQFEVYCMEAGEESLLSKIHKVEITKEEVLESMVGANYREKIGTGKMNECVRKLIYG